MKQRMKAYEIFEGFKARRRVCSFGGFLRLEGKTKSLDEKKRMRCMCVLEGGLEGKMKSLFSG